MKILLFSGDNLRHKYFANHIIDNYDVGGIVIQKRDYDREKKFALDIELEYSGEDAKLMDWHFSLREKKEKEYFGKHDNFNSKKELKFLSILPEELNTEKTINFVKDLSPDVVIVYGTSLFKKELLSVCPEYTINCHGGLSPWYRGAATLFWPIYFMEPEKIGVTFHIISLRIDHGDIIHQCRPEIFSDDTVHDIGCRAIVIAADHIIKILKKLEESDKLELYPQRQSGKLFSKRDFRPYHLRVIKWLMDNQYLKEYVHDKDSPLRKVNLIEQA